MSRHPGITWPFPVGTTTPDEEPTDAQLASTGVNTYPSDPGDSPSYTNFTYPKGTTP